jgi:hypothetical protein
MIETEFVLVGCQNWVQSFAGVNFEVLLVFILFFFFFFLMSSSAAATKRGRMLPPRLGKSVGNV